MSFSVGCVAAMLDGSILLLVLTTYEVVRYLTQNSESKAATVLCDGMFAVGVLLNNSTEYTVD